MIREIYETLTGRLLATGKVKYVDLWNQNVEFIEQESAWPTPAVFIEFSPIEWGANHQGELYFTESSVVLHIVTEWLGGTSNLDVDKDNHLEMLDVMDAIHKALRYVNGEHFKGMSLSSTTMNHNHEELVETIESYSYQGILNCNR